MSVCLWTKWLWVRVQLQSPEQMIQRLPITIVHVKAGNTIENWLSEIRQVVYSLYQEKDVTKKVDHNVINSIKS